jgi:hypothetical protein
MLKVVVKADTQGSVEAIVDALAKIETDKVKLEVIHSAVGAITENDVALASASKASSSASTPAWTAPRRRKPSTSTCRSSFTRSSMN